MKKTASIFLPLILLWSCATTQGPTPSLHIGALPPSVVGELSLEERILAEEGWNDLKQGRESRAEKTLSKLGLESPIYAVGLGYINSLSNRLQAAEKFFRQALQYRPELALAHSGSVLRTSLSAAKALSSCPVF